MAGLKPGATLAGPLSTHVHSGLRHYSIGHGRRVAVAFVPAAQVTPPAFAVHRALDDDRLGRFDDRARTISSASSGTSPPGPRRDVEAARRVHGERLVTTGAPFSRRNVIVTFAGSRAGIREQDVGLIRRARRRRGLRRGPISCAVAVTPKLLCASYHCGAGSGQYCARSTTIGSVDVDLRRDRGVGERRIFGLDVDRQRGRCAGIVFVFVDRRAGRRQDT